jgi:hypothetical protein
MKLSSCSAATAPRFTPVDRGGGGADGFAECGCRGCGWSSGGTVRRAGGRVCMPL